MASLAETQPTETQEQVNATESSCVKCGLATTLNDGAVQRGHGLQCRSCNNVYQILYRHLGGLPPSFQGMSTEEQGNFFKSTGKDVATTPKNGRWSLVKKNLVTLNPTSVEGSKTFIKELRSSATGNQFRLECVTTPPAAARTRSSFFGISDKERLSHSLPCETAPKRSSSNLAADASSTYGIRHTATTKQPSSYNFFPLLMHINENITHGSTTSQTNIGMITMQFSRSHGQPLQRPKEMQQMLKIFVSRSLVFYKHDAMSDICHFIFLWKFPHKWDKTARYHDAVYDT